MVKGIILRTCMLIILVVLYPNPVWVAMADDCQCEKSAPTSAGDVKRCYDDTPTIVATYSGGLDTIDSSHPVTLQATGGSNSYTWSTDSKGYSLSSDEGETVTLSVISGTCGTNYDVYSTVTVTDSCTNNPQSATIEIRNTSGHWNYIDGGGCGGVLVTDCTANIISGKKRIMVEFGHETTPFTCGYGCGTTYCPCTWTASQQCGTIPNMESFIPGSFDKAVAECGIGLYCCNCLMVAPWTIAQYSQGASAYQRSMLRSHYLWTCP